MPGGRVLVAGVGNVLLGDDGFGVEVVRRLRDHALPDSVRLIDAGIRGIHLAYEILDGGYDTMILVDAASRGEAPGTVSLIEPSLGVEDVVAAPADAHGMTPDAVLGLLRALGATSGRVLIVGCEPASVEEGVGLTPPVARAVDDAVRLVLDLLGLARVKEE
jgi:hydrogenase maturation protease